MAAYRYEYMVLGYDGPELTGKRSLHAALLDLGGQPVVDVTEVKDILDALGRVGWEAVLLTFPYVFRRLRGGSEYV